MFIFNLHCQIVLRISGNMLQKKTSFFSKVSSWRTGTVQGFLLFLEEEGEGRREGCINERKSRAKNGAHG